MNLRQTYTFDDVLLVPKRGVLNKRIDADISSEIVSGEEIEIPIISANMPSVTGPYMAAMMWSRGAYGILHRFKSDNERTADYLEVNAEYNSMCGVSLGLKDSQIIATFYAMGCKIFCLDVAHGDHEQVLEFVANFKSNGLKNTKLIVGNVATEAAAAHLSQVGADAIKVGVGPGAACRTREVTGFGVPQLSAIMDVARNKEYFPDVKIIADGGIKNSGDIVKALAAGADTVMIGSLLAGCDEAPNPGEYYGNASHHINGHRAPEGSYGQVEKRGSVENIIKELAWGIRSGLSYGGATNLAELKENAEFIQVTAAGQQESQVRLNQDKYIFHKDNAVASFDYSSIGF